MIDEFGIDISPGTYTLAAITEVRLNNQILIGELVIKSKMNFKILLKLVFIIDNQILMLICR